LRSLLFVPADNPSKLGKAMSAGADAIVIDLEDSVAPANKEEGRRNALALLREHADDSGGPLLLVRVNALNTPFNEGDLDIVMTGVPDGIMLPKATGGADITLLHARLSVREAIHGIDDGQTGIVAIATESAAAMFGLGTYAGASPRLAGLAWGAEDLSADIGATASRTEGVWTEPFKLARNLCLFAATAAEVAAIDTVHTEFRDLNSLRRECEEAVRDGFSGKLAIHPDQVPVINDAFTPAAEAIAHAKRVAAAFAKAGGAGVTSLDGLMIDRPHLKSAERLLARRKRDNHPKKQ
jgi:citrate lyase subunit beta/citryl-CoA lyase